MLTKKELCILLFVVIILAVIDIYVYEIVINDVRFSEWLARTLTTILNPIAGIIRLVSRTSRQSLGFYESQYKKEIGKAFENEFSDKKKHLCAIRL